MQKKVFILIIAFLCLIPAATSCGRAKKVKSMAFNEKNYILDKGENKKLNVSITPEGAEQPQLQWSSDNPGVAAVDKDGNVTAIAQGNAKIKASTLDGKFFAECDISVKERKVSLIKLSKAEITIEVGSYETLTASIEPNDADNKSLLWSSDSANIAKVDETGKVTAVAEGKTVIHAKSYDGSIVSDCTATIIPKKKPVSNGTSTQGKTTTTQGTTTESKPAFFETSHNAGNWSIMPYTHNDPRFPFIISFREDSSYRFVWIRVAGQPDSKGSNVKVTARLSGKPDMSVEAVFKDYYAELAVNYESYAKTGDVVYLYLDITYKGKTYKCSTKFTAM